MPFLSSKGGAPSRRRAAVAAIPVVLALLVGGCSDSTGPTAQSPWTGTLYYEDVASGVYRYDFASGTEAAMFAGLEPTRFPSGEFLVLDDDAQKVEVVSANGAQRSTIFDGGAWYSVFDPKVSPDGSKVAFTFYDKSSSTYTIKTVIVSRNGDVLQQVDEAGSPEWLPDGRLMVSGSWLYPYDLTSVIKTYGTDGFFILDAAMTGVTQVPLAVTKAIRPGVSPDGTRIAFVLNDHIWTANIDGSNLKQVTMGTKHETYPSWSPDGKYIACVCYGTFETTFYNALAIVPSNPSTPTAMANDAAIWPRGTDRSTTTDRLNADSYVVWR